MKKINWLILGAFVVLSEIAGSVGSIFTIPAIPNWYASLVKPDLNPPNWIFGPVWMALFALMGIAAYLVWRRGWETKQVREALTVFLAQFAFNIVWSVLFFGLKSLLLGLFDIVLLWVLILVTLLKFYKVDKLAGYLLIPYLVWVSFATYLNFMILILN